MTAHHDRVRTVLLVHELEAMRRWEAGEDPLDAADLAARVARIQSRFDDMRSRIPEVCVSDGPHADTGATPADWLLAVYDAALAELCTALGVDHSLVDHGVCSEGERQRVELSLLSLVPTLW